MNHNPFSLLGKKILVTGASSGIGRAIAIECSKMGAEIIITARNPQRLDETFSLLSGANNLQLVTDLEDKNDLSALIDQLPPLSGVVHCAGVTKILPFSFVSEKALTSVMNINFIIPTLMTAQLIKKKKIINEGSIVFISSINGIKCSSISSSIYAASKGAVNGLIKGMALDLAPKKIRVNSVNPGMIETNLLKSNNITEEQLEQDKTRYPLKRYGEPEEVAYATIYLLSNASKWVTGSNLVIDGGYTLY